jgi:hypothetical protein
MSVLSRVVWNAIAGSLVIAATAAYPQDRAQFREQAKTAEAELRAAGEPKDRCTLEAYLAGDGVVTRTFASTGLVPGDRLLTLSGVDVSAMGAGEIINILRDTDPSAVISITVERQGEFVDIEVPCSNARAANEALMTGLSLAGRGRFDDCVEAISRDDLGTQAAALKAGCASVSRNASRYDLAELAYIAMRMAIEDAHWVPDTRADVIEGLRAAEGMVTQARFQELVAATRGWPGGERMYDASAPDWALFRRSSEAALRARLLDPDSARIEWPYGFRYGSWTPAFSRPIDGYWTCGSVNARNRMGGYTGSTFFVVVLDPDGKVKFVNIGESSDFDIVTSQCNGSVRLLPHPPPELSGATVSQQGPSTSIADELAKLVDLRDSGALTESEFQAAKARLLGTSGQE